MTAIYLLQLVLPLLLIAWLGAAPPRALWAFWLQVVATAAALWALAWLGIWLLPPWWAPPVFGVGLAVAAWMGWHRRRPFASSRSVTVGGWVTSATFVTLGVVSVYGIAIAWRSRTVPPVLAVNLAFPLEAGRYLVVNGGSGISTNLHLMTLDTSVPRFLAWRGQSYGVDIVALDAWGLRARGVQPADPRAYRIFGARVLAPCAGRVLLAVDGLPDMPVPQVDREHMAGNHVLLRCATAIAATEAATEAVNEAVNEADVLLGHLQPGSLQVRAGAAVAVADWLGLVGNSGNTAEPHLHVHAQRPGRSAALLGGDPLPILFMGRYPVRGDRFESP